MGRFLDMEDACCYKMTGIDHLTVVPTNYEEVEKIETEEKQDVEEKEQPYELKSDIK